MEGLLRLPGLEPCAVGPCRAGQKKICGVVSLAPERRIAGQSG